MPDGMSLEQWRAKKAQAKPSGGMSLDQWRAAKSAPVAPPAPPAPNFVRMGGGGFNPSAAQFQNVPKRPDWLRDSPMVGPTVRMGEVVYHGIADPIAGAIDAASANYERDWRAEEFRKNHPELANQPSMSAPSSAADFAGIVGKGTFGTTMGVAQVAEPWMLPLVASQAAAQKQAEDEATMQGAHPALGVAAAPAKALEWWAQENAAPFAEKAGVVAHDITGSPTVAKGVEGVTDFAANMIPFEAAGLGRRAVTSIGKPARPTMPPLERVPVPEQIPGTPSGRLSAARPAPVAEPVAPAMRPVPPNVTQTTGVRAASPEMAAELRLANAPTLAIPAPAPVVETVPGRLRTSKPAPIDAPAGPVAEPQLSPGEAARLASAKFRGVVPPSRAGVRINTERYPAIAELQSADAPGATTADGPPVRAFVKGGTLRDALNESAPPRLQTAARKAGYEDVWAAREALRTDENAATMFRAGIADEIAALPDPQATPVTSTEVTGPRLRPAALTPEEPPRAPAPPPPAPAAPAPPQGVRPPKSAESAGPMDRPRFNPMQQEPRAAEPPLLQTTGENPGVMEPGRAPPARDASDFTSDGGGRRPRALPAPEPVKPAPVAEVAPTPRPIPDADAPNVATMQRRSFNEGVRAEKGKPGVETFPADDYGFTEAVFRDENGVVRGVASYSSATDTHKANINVAVDPAFQRKGIASSLYRALEESGVPVSDVSGTMGMTESGAAFVKGRKRVAPAVEAKPASHELPPPAEPAVKAKASNLPPPAALEELAKAMRASEMYDDRLIRTSITRARGSNSYDMELHDKGAGAEALKRKASADDLIAIYKRQASERNIPWEEIDAAARDHAQKVMGLDDKFRTKHEASVFASEEARKVESDKWRTTAEANSRRMQSDLDAKNAAAAAAKRAETDAAEAKRASEARATQERSAAIHEDLVSKIASKVTPEGGRAWKSAITKKAQKQIIDNVMIASESRNEAIVREALDRAASKAAPPLEAPAPASVPEIPETSAPAPSPQRAFIDRFVQATREGKTEDAAAEYRLMSPAERTKVHETLVADGLWKRGDGFSLPAIKAHADRVVAAEKAAAPAPAKPYGVNKGKLRRGGKQSGAVFNPFPFKPPKAPTPESVINESTRSFAPTISERAQKTWEAITKLTPGTGAFRHRFLDKLGNLERYEREMTGTVSDTGPTAFARVAARGASGAAEAYATRGVLLGTDKFHKPLVNTLEPIAHVEPKAGSLRKAKAQFVNMDNVRDFEAFVLARRAQDYIARGLDPGIDPVKAQEILAKRANDPVFQRAAKEFTEWQNRPFELLLKEMGIPDTDIAAIRERNPNFTHVERVFSDEWGKSGDGGKGIAGVGNAVKKITGSKRAIYHPIEAALANTEAVLQALAKVRAQRRLIEVAEQFDTTGEGVKKVPPQGHVLHRELGDFQKQIKDALGVDMTPEQASTIIDIWNAKHVARPNERIVTMWKDGKPQSYELHPDLMRVMAEIGPEGASRATQLAKMLRDSPLGLATRTMKMGATGYRIGFSAIANPIRDFIESLVNSEYWSAYPRGMKESVMRGTRATDVYKASGASSGSFAHAEMGAPGASAKSVLRASSAVGRAKNFIGRGPNALIRASEFTEGIPRKGEFLVDLEAQGWNPRSGVPPTVEQAVRAANKAADVTIDFSRIGEWMQPLNQIVPFLNPAIQGTNKTIRNFHRRPVATLGRTLATAGMASLALWYLNKDREAYKNKTAWQRKNYWNAEIDGTDIQLPKPPGYVSLIANLVEDTADAMYREGTFPKDLEETIKEYLKNAAPPVMPLGMDVYVGVKSNKDDFTGRPIVKRSLEDVDVADQYDEQTTETAKAVAKILGVSPIKTDWVMNRLTGNMSRDVIGTVERWTGADKDRAAYTKPPVFGRFIASDAASDAFEEFWEIKKDLETRRATVNLRKRMPERGDAPYFVPPKILTHISETGKVLTDMRNEAIKETDKSKRAAMMREFHDAARSARDYVKEWLAESALPTDPGAK